MVNKPVEHRWLIQRTLGSHNQRILGGSLEVITTTSTAGSSLAPADSVKNARPPRIKDVKSKTTMGEDATPERNQLSRQDASVTGFRCRSPLAKTGRLHSTHDDPSSPSERSTLTVDSEVFNGISMPRARDRPQLRQSASVSFSSRSESPGSFIPPANTYGDPPPIAGPSKAKVANGNRLSPRIPLVTQRSQPNPRAERKQKMHGRPRTVSGNINIPEGWMPQKEFGDEPPIANQPKEQKDKHRNSLVGVPQKNPFFGDSPLVSVYTGPTKTPSEERKKKPLVRTPKLLATPVEVSAPNGMYQDETIAASTQSLVPLIELSMDESPIMDTSTIRQRFMEFIAKQEQNIRTDDLLIDVNDDICDLDSPLCLGAPSLSVPTMPPKSAPPCPSSSQYNGMQNGEVSQSNGSTPTILRHDGTMCTDSSHQTNAEYIRHNGLGSSESKLQQSLSTPNPQDEGLSTRKESEYRRFKSEGSSAGVVPPENDDSAYDDLSPITDRATTPHRFNLIQQDSVVNGGPISKQSDTEKVFMMQTLKQKLSKYQSFIDKAFHHMIKGTEQINEADVIEGCTIVSKVLSKAGTLKKVSQDLTTALCDFLRDQTYLDQIIKLFVAPSTCDPVRFHCGRVLEESFSENNMEYIVNKGWLKKLVLSAMKMNKSPDQQRMNMSIIEKLFAHKESTTLTLIEIGVLDHILLTCKMEMNSLPTQRHSAIALCNMALHANAECRKKIAMKRIPEWLFLLASRPDDPTRYYACLAICVLSCMKDMVKTTDTLKLVEPFLQQHSPSSFAADVRHWPGRSTNWLQKLVPLLRHGVKKEARSAASYHFALEAIVKKEQNKLIVFQEIGAIQALKEVAGYPDEVAAKFASEALAEIGEEVPYKLAQQVPSWTISDVQYWVKKIGFEDYVDNFAKQMVDGDLLLHLSERDLERDIKMESGLHRKRFLRELESLKIAADYSSVDDTNLDHLLMSLSPELSVYTYKMLTNGVNRNILPSLTDELMQSACGIENPIHRLKLTQAFRDYKHPDDVEVAMLSKQIDIFISYRRSTGNQLASLIKVLLQLKGYKVFIDVDRLYAGKFDLSLLKNIKAAKHFILVLTPGSMDRLLNDNNKEDWIHKELSCAFENAKNIVPIFEQNFEFPDEMQIPEDIRMITKYNGVRWIHDYQEACISKVMKFIEGDLNRTPSLNQPDFELPTPASLVNSRVISTSSVSVATRKSHPRFHGSVRQASTSSNRSRLGEPTTPSPNFTPSNSTEKVRRKPLASSASTAVDR